MDYIGFLKLEPQSAGVARRCSEIAGWIENFQIEVFLSCATRTGRLFLEREFDLPKARDRCFGASIPSDRGFATTPELAMSTITRALDADLPAQCVTADAAYGPLSMLRETPDGRDVFYVLAMTMDQCVLSKNGALGAERWSGAFSAFLSGFGKAGRPTAARWPESARRRQRPEKGRLASGPAFPDRPRRDRVVHLPRT